MTRGPRTIKDQVALALRHYDRLEHLGHIQAYRDGDQEIRTPNPTAYALGWIIANAIVQKRYASSGIDAIPIDHPEHGWDRFLLSRRVSCSQRSQERADRFGLILLHGEDAPHFATNGETIQLSLGASLRQDPEGTIRTLLERIPDPGLRSGDHQGCWHTRAAKEYPLLYDVIVDLILEHPGLIAAREIYIDDDLVNNAYHPLYIHTGGRIIGFVHDWFGVQYGDQVAYIRVHGRGAVHRTERGTWRLSSTPRGDLDWAEMRANIAAWLRLDSDQTSQTP
jgi:hypothetical protein